MNTIKLSFKIDAHALARSSFIVYTFILSLSWMLLNYGGDGQNPYSGTGVRWVVLTIPLLIFVFVNVFIFVFKPKINIDIISASLICYLFFGMALALMSSDLAWFLDIARFAVPIFIIYHFRLYLTLRFINVIFTIALILVILTYNSESLYGYLPGQTKLNLHQGLWWRISIWKYITPPYSAAIGLLVMFANITLNKHWSKYLFIVIAVYFVLLSASRTAYCILVSLILIIIMVRKYNFNKKIILLAMPFLFAGMLFLLQFISDLVFLLNIENEFVKSAILRTSDESGANSTLSSRLLIIAEHIRLMSEDRFLGLLGLGSRVNQSAAWLLNGGLLGGSTDSLISHLLARDGMLFLFLFTAFFGFLRKSLKEENLLSYLTLTMLLMYVVAYGAWLNVTSPVFLMFMGIVMHSKNGKSKRI